MKVVPLAKLSPGLSAAILCRVPCGRLSVAFLAVLINRVASSSSVILSVQPMIYRVTKLKMTAKVVANVASSPYCTVRRYWWWLWVATFGSYWTLAGL